MYHLPRWHTFNCPGCGRRQRTYQDEPRVIDGVSGVYCTACPGCGAPAAPASRPARTPTTPRGWVPLLRLRRAAAAEESES